MKNKDVRSICLLTILVFTLVQLIGGQSAFSERAPERGRLDRDGKPFDLISDAEKEGSGTSGSYQDLEYYIVPKGTPDMAFRLSFPQSRSKNYNSVFFDKCSLNKNNAQQWDCKSFAYVSSDPSQASSDANPALAPAASAPTTSVPSARSTLSHIELYIALMASMLPDQERQEWRTEEPGLFQYGLSKKVMSGPCTSGLCIQKVILATAIPLQYFHSFDVFHPDIIVQALMCSMTEPRPKSMAETFLRVAEYRENLRSVNMHIKEPNADYAFGQMQASSESYKRFISTQRDMQTLEANIKLLLDLAPSLQIYDRVLDSMHSEISF